LGFSLCLSSGDYSDSSVLFFLSIFLSYLFFPSAQQWLACFKTRLPIKRKRNCKKKEKKEKKKIKNEIE